jgi:hypothetical protein
VPIVLFPGYKQLLSDSSGFLHLHDEKSNGVVFDDIRHFLSEIDQVVPLFMGHDALAITTIWVESHVRHLIRVSLIKLRRLCEPW